MIADLAPMDVASRAPRLVAALDEVGCDALLVTHLTNVRYLSGFTGSAGVLVVRPDQVVLVTDGRYGDQARAQLEAARVDGSVEVSSAEQRRLVREALAGCRRVGLEAEHISWARQQELAGAWLPAHELIGTAGLVEGLRLDKDDGELARLEAASAIADAALAEVRPRLGAGASEREVALELDTAMRRLGADGPSFETIVASGPNGARPHARPGDRRIGRGDLVVLDFGALVDGYHSDMTRTIAVGEPSATQARMLAVVGEAQAAGVAAVRAGATASEVDRACRAIIDEAGWAEAFVHATGHGVGLDIHEAPRVAGTSDATLAARQVVTVEPGVYLAEHGGVRIEDTVIVTPDGCRPITHTTKSTAV